VTNSSKIYKKLKVMRTHGMTKTAYERSIDGYSHYDVKNLGWKYNMSNIEASILLPQFKKIQTKLTFSVAGKNESHDVIPQNKKLKRSVD
jgi:dTDP-4-amino-4,6-dideoxygalactose transaminase